LIFSQLRAFGDDARLYVLSVLRQSASLFNLPAGRNNCSVSPYQLEGGSMKERRRHKRFPIIKDLAEPIEISFIDSHNKHRQFPGVLTNFSAGGMDLVLMGTLEGRPMLNLSFHLPGFDRFMIEGRVVWTHAKENTEIVGILFTKIDPDHAHQINHMAEAYWECENRIRQKALTVCFHGCVFWDLCEKDQKIPTAPKKKAASLN